MRLAVNVLGDCGLARLRSGFAMLMLVNFIRLSFDTTVARLTTWRSGGRSLLGRSAWGSSIAMPCSCSLVPSLWGVGPDDLRTRDRWARSDGARQIHVGALRPLGLCCQRKNLLDRKTAQTRVQAPPRPPCGPRRVGHRAQRLLAQAPISRSARARPAAVRQASIELLCDPLVVRSEEHTSELQS